MSEKVQFINHNFASSLSNSLFSLISNNSLCDVTLVCDDGQLFAHKVILAACSSFFCSLFNARSSIYLPHQQCLLFIRGVKYHQMKALLQYIYQGNAEIKEEDIRNVLEVANDLKIEGLTQMKTPTEKQNIDHAKYSSDVTKKELIKRSLSDTLSREKSTMMKKRYLSEESSFEDCVLSKNGYVQEFSPSLEKEGSQPIKHSYNLENSYQEVYGKRTLFKENTFQNPNFSSTKQKPEISMDYKIRIPNKFRNDESMKEIKSPKSLLSDGEDSTTCISRGWSKSSIMESDPIFEDEDYERNLVIDIKESSKLDTVLEEMKVSPNEKQKFELTLRNQPIFCLTCKSIDGKSKSLEHHMKARRQVQCEHCFMMFSNCNTLKLHFGICKAFKIIKK